MGGEPHGQAGGHLPAGSLVAGYRLEEQVGAGGMAVVYRARDVRLGRVVAVKVLAPAVASDEEFRHRFLRESRAAAAVDDPVKWNHTVSWTPGNVSVDAASVAVSTPAPGQVLADFGTVHFTAVKVDGYVIGSFDSMIRWNMTRHNHVLAATSPLGNTGGSFAITWKRAS